ncbi:hypothetical protein AV530_011087 [Patagioenas fasciata monilis]|uniref:Uncharacterized protein n=1 Tax=Patagioenas fasciata monilis TaxID=372326 RepID=A0A1V4JVV0_PATFA|nr:hypothetical protein AV530_011087 [Patagioenas fasciata monilis]
MKARKRGWNFATESCRHTEGSGPTILTFMKTWIPLERLGFFELGRRGKIAAGKAGWISSPSLASASAKGSCDLGYTAINAAYRSGSMEGSWC